MATETYYTSAIDEFLATFTERDVWNMNRLVREITLTSRTQPEQTETLTLTANPPFRNAAGGMAWLGASVQAPGARTLSLHWQQQANARGAVITHPGQWVANEWGGERACCQLVNCPHVYAATTPEEALQLWLDSIDLRRLHQPLPEPRCYSCGDYERRGDPLRIDMFGFIHRSCQGD